MSKAKSTVELQRQRISLLCRAQATIVRAEYLNAILPPALAEFDRRLQSGEEIRVDDIDLNQVVANAIVEVHATELGQ
jgi:hypothetical protein